MDIVRATHAGRMLQVVLIIGMAAIAGVPGSAIAQATLSVAAPYQSIQIPIVRWGKDPNLPDLGGDLGEPVMWTMINEDAYRVDFRRPSARGRYLGFNERGSWIENQDDRRVYIWNLKSRTLTLGAESRQGVPLDLKNPSPEMKDLIADATGHGSSGHTSADISGRNTPYIPPSVVGDGNAQYAGGATPSGVLSSGSGTNAPGAGVTTQLKGSAASLSAGVLTFTNEAGASVSLKVVRPPNQAFGNPNASKATGIAGAWLAEDPTDKSVVITLNVTENGVVSGTRMTGIAAQALKRIMSTPR